MILDDIQDVWKRLAERDAFERELRLMRIVLGNLLLEHRGGEMHVSERELEEGAPGLTLTITRSALDDGIHIRAKQR